MILSDVSIKRPVFATMLNLVLVVFGLFALPELAVDQYPNVDFPIITATVTYPGADPETIEQKVLEPLEEAVNGIAGLDKVSGNAYPNIAQLVIQFKLEKNGDQASQEVRDKIFAKLSDLPKEAETPVIQKFDVGGAPVLTIAVSNPKSEYGALSNLTNDVIKPAVERINGVAAVTLSGARLREIHVLVNRKELSGYGITPADVVNSVSSQNVDIPAGKLQNDTNYWNLRVKGRSDTASQIANLPVLSTSASGLRVGNVSRVEDTIADKDSAGYINKQETILLSVQRQSGSNTPQVSLDVRKGLEKLKSQLPEGTKIDVVSDNSIFIKGSIDSVKLDLVLGAALATFIVFIFLRDPWITLISAIALPVSVLATFAFLRVMHFSLNMMSTLGLSLAIGILIDDAIIVIENIHRHLAMGKSGADAARDATSEIGLAVFATTLTIVAVFVPVAFMEGIVGRFFYQFGLTVAFAVIASLFCAFTIAPMMAARLLKPGEYEPKTAVLRKGSHSIDRFLTSLDNRYKSILEWSLGNRFKVLLGALLIFLSSFVLLKFVPVSFFPKEDRGEFTVNYTLPEGTSIDGTTAKSFVMIDAIQKFPGIKQVITALAAGADRKPNTARIYVQLVDKHERSFSQEDMIQRMRKELAPRFAVEGSEVSLTEQSGGGGNRSEPIQYIFQSDHWDKLVAFTEQAKKDLPGLVPGTTDVNTTKPKDAAEYRIVIDQGRAADLGLTTAQVGGALRALYEGDKISDIVANSKTVDVRLRVADIDRVSATDLSAITLQNARGEQISLASIAEIKLSNAPSTIERFNRQRQITLVSNFTGKDLNKAANQIDAYVAKNMPVEVTLNKAGQTEMMTDAIKAILKALAIAILLVYMILCAQYESYLAPLVIMAALPLSLTGAFGSLVLTGQAMSIFTMIGIILLMGLVTKNGILLIDFTMQQIHSGHSVHDALMMAGPVRLRPILMTTFAAGGGMIPIAIGHGVGGEARSPMGVAVIGGLLLSTLLTLVVVPCLFSVVEEWQERFKHWRAHKKGIALNDSSKDIAAQKAH
ncbi:MAG: efflux RND transporter permease subunit [Chitinophagaceae bacterium]|nr:efflux RND transporter permease subunit [Oligoflexus sp.]